MRKGRDALLEPDASEADAPKTAAAFASAPLAGIIRFTDATGTKTLDIHKAKEDCYAKSSTLEGVYKTNKDLCDGLDKTPRKPSHKKLFDFAFNDPTRVTFKDGDKSTTYEKKDGTWKADGKVMDSVGIQNLIDKLRDASATKLADSGFTTPVVEITVVSNESKLTDKVQISQAKDAFFAKRDGDTTI